MSGGAGGRLMVELERAMRDAALRRLSSRRASRSTTTAGTSTSRPTSSSTGHGELRDRYGLHHHRTIRAGLLLQDAPLGHHRARHRIGPGLDSPRAGGFLWPVARETLGDDARTTIITRWLLAEATLHEGYTDEALAHYEGVQRPSSPEPPTAIASATSPRRWVADALRRHEEAEPIFRRMIRVRTETSVRPH